ncbi:MAG: Ig-like domain-containing protein, partial [Pseudomonadota bacterium]
PPRGGVVRGVPPPQHDSTPDVTINTNEAGSLAIGGSCGSGDEGANASGNQTNTLTQPDNSTPLADGTFSDCTITVTDGAGNSNTPVTLTSFEIDLTSPTLAEVTPVADPTDDSTPNVTISSDEAGTLAVGGSCGSGDEGAIGSGNQTITLTQTDNSTPLAEGTYSDCTVTVSDAAGNSDTPLTLTEFEIDLTPPTVLSIVRQTPMTTPTNADTLVFRVTFSEDVQNVSTSAFIVSGGSTATATNVATDTADSVFDVTVSGGDLAEFDGTVGLDLARLRAKGDPTIADPAGNALDTTEPPTDETYTLDNTPPDLLSITRQDPMAASTNADTVVFRVTFDGDAQNVDAMDFVVSGGSTATVTGFAEVTPNALYDLTVSGGDITTFTGTIGIDLSDPQDIADTLGNAYDGAEPPIDEVYQLVVVEAENDMYSVDEGNLLGVALGSGLHANDSALDVNALMVTAIDGLAVVGTDYTPAGGGTLNVAADGMLTFDTADEFESLNDGETATVTFTYTTSDGDTEDTATVTITVNGEDDTLVAQDDGFTTLEDSAVSGNVIDDNGNGIDFGGEADEVLVTTSGTFDAEGIGGEVVLGADGAFTYTPPANTSGMATFDYSVADNTVLTDTATVTIEVTPVNDAPSFTAGPDQTLAKGAELIQSVPGWATDITPGPDEDDQELRFQVTIVEDPNGVLDGDVRVTKLGELRYSLTSTGGTAVVSVIARDSGGVSSGGENRSDAVTFEITYLETVPAQVILRRSDTQKWTLYLLDGYTRLSNGARPFSPNPAWTTRAVRDLNGDGVEDLLIRNDSNGEWHVYYLNGATGLINSRRHIGVSLDLADEFQGVGDLNGDGIGDVLTRNGDSWKAWYLTSTGNIAFSQVLAIDVPATTSTQGIGDFDGDGTDELLVRDTATGEWTSYTFAPGTGEVTGTRMPAMTTSDQWTFQGVGNFDGNARDDVLMRRSNGRWLIYNFDASGAVASDPRVSMTPNRTWEVRWLDDFDGDGNTDVLLRRTNTLLWTLYRLDGSSVLEQGKAPLTPKAVWQTQQQ